MPAHVCVFAAEILKPASSHLRRSIALQLMEEMTVTEVFQRHLCDVTIRALQLVFTDTLTVKNLNGLILFKVLISH